MPESFSESGSGRALSAKANQQAALRLDTRLAPGLFSKHGTGIAVRFLVYDKVRDDSAATHAQVDRLEQLFSHVEAVTTRTSTEVQSVASGGSRTLSLFRRGPAVAAPVPAPRFNPRGCTPEPLAYRTLDDPAPAADQASCERRVHQDGRRANSRVEEVMDELTVVRAERSVRVGCCKAAPAARVDFIHDKAATGARGGQGKQPGPGGWLKHQIGTREPGRASHEPGERQRRRKGLQRDLLLGAISLGWKRAGQILKAAQGRGGFAIVDRRDGPSDEQDLRELKRVIAVAQGPAAFGIGAAGRCAQQLAKGFAANRLPGGEHSREDLCGLDDRVGRAAGMRGIARFECKRGLHVGSPLLGRATIAQAGQLSRAPSPLLQLIRGRG